MKQPIKMKHCLLAIFSFLSVVTFAQDDEQSTSNKLTWGGYGEVHFNAYFDEDVRRNSKLDVHRIVLMNEYNFSDKTKLFAEYEFEHVKELYVEQAYIQHEILPWLKLRAGLILTPMGIINEYHEPATFNGVERPSLDSRIVPSTWREIGFGFTGRFDEAKLKYQAYLMNGFNGYDGGTVLSGSSALRSGRQKGAESYASSPNVALKVEHYGISGLKLGLAGFFGKTESDAFDGLDKDDSAAEAFADSTTVGIAMIGLDYRYNNGGFQSRGQLVTASLSNTDEYNGLGSDLGSQLFGYYVEAGYNVLHSTEASSELIPFLRYEKYNTHADTESGTAVNDAYDRTDITFGLTYKPTPLVAFKFDYQIKDDATSNDLANQLNLGVGYYLR